MDFEFDADQRSLQEAARAVIDKECPLSFVRSVVDGAADPTLWWKTMVGLDWPAMAIPEDLGGLGLGWVELAILLEELGRAIDPSPMLATTSQFAPAIRNCGTAEQAQRWLPLVAAGTLTGTLAVGGLHDPLADPRHLDGPSAVNAAREEGGWNLCGSVRAVVDADRADEIAVVANTPDGVGVFVVPSPSEALGITRTAAFDRTAHLTDLVLDGARVSDDRRLAGVNVVEGARRAIEEATLGWALATVGACQRILELTVDYVKQRHQFGQPIGAFQAVKHKAVDMFVSFERARALVYYAALTIAEDDSRRTHAVWMAKAAAGDCQRVVVPNGIQLFGGMGFTWENDLHFALNRAKLGGVLFGRATEHRQRLAADALFGSKTLGRSPTSGVADVPNVEGVVA